MALMTMASRGCMLEACSVPRNEAPCRTTVDVDLSEFPKQQKPAQTLKSTAVERDEEDDPVNLEEDGLSVAQEYNVINVSLHQIMTL